MPMIENSKKVVSKKVLYIYNLVWFKKNKVQALINLNNKVNIISLIYAINLSLKIRFINVGTQKIGSSIIEIFEIVLTSIKVEDKLG